MANYKIIVQNNKTGETDFQCIGDTVIAGAARGENARVFFSAENEDEAAALINAAEEAFGGAEKDE